MTEDNDDLPWVVLSGDKPYPGPHSAEFEEHNGKVLFKFAMNGRNFAGGQHNICMTLSKEQALIMLSDLQDAMLSAGYLPPDGH